MALPMDSLQETDIGTDNDDPYAHLTEEEREEEIKRLEEQWAREEQEELAKAIKIEGLIPQLKKWGSLPVPPESTCECRYLTKGGSFFVFELVFENGVTCIARVAQEILPATKLLSEVYATRRIKACTSIPVPTIYLCETDTNNILGSQYMLVERMEGERLDHIWDTMTVEDKMSVVKQMAKFLIDLSALKFESIGWLLEDGYQVGPYLHENRKKETGPFPSTLEYFLSYLPMELAVSSKARGILETYFCTITVESALSPPFYLIHPDLNLCNILVTRSTTPIISAFLDWEYVQTGPRYLFYEYPPFILGNPSPPDGQFLPTNKILRDYFQAQLFEFCTSDEQRKEVRACMEKNYLLTGFNFCVIGSCACQIKEFEGMIYMYVRACEKGCGMNGQDYLYDGAASDDEKTNFAWEGESSDEETSDKDTTDDESEGSLFTTDCDST